MRKSSAIKILEHQKQIFIDKSHKNTTAWLKLTGSYISEFLGHDSVEYSSFSKFEFTTRFVNMPDEIIKLTQKGEQSEIIGLLQNSIEKLKTGKLYRKPQLNILSSQTNERLIAIMFAISSIVFTVGYYFGTEKTNRDLIQTEIKYKNLKDSLSSVKPFVDTQSMPDEKK